MSEAKGTLKQKKNVKYICHSECNTFRMEFDTINPMKEKPDQKESATDRCELNEIHFIETTATLIFHLSSTCTIYGCFFTSLIICLCYYMRFNPKHTHNDSTNVSTEKIFGKKNFFFTKLSMKFNDFSKK